MRIIRHRLDNRIAHMAVVIVLCILLVGLIPIRVAFAAGMEVSLPYEQKWQNASGSRVDNAFRYELTAADSKSPLPAESSGGSYTFTLTGNDTGKLVLYFGFTKPDYYHYTVRPLTRRTKDGYTYDPPVYDVMIMVVNGSDGLQVGAVTIEDSARAKSGDKAKYAALEYSAAYETKPQEDTPEESQGAPPGWWTPVPGEDIPFAPAAPQEPGEEDPGGPDDGIEEPIPPKPGIDIDGEDYWALLNLILMILTILIALIDGILYFRRSDDDDDDEDQNDRREQQSQPEDDEQDKVKKHGLLRILALIVAVISLIVFILTEDMRLPMRWVDEYTIWMIILFVVEVILAFLSRRSEDEDEEEEEEEETG